MILPARTILIALLAFALFPATTALAGPPLLCPEAVFTEAETLALSKIAKDAKPDAKVRVVLSLLAASDSARFRGETLRWFRLSHSKSFAPLLRAIEARVERLGDQATALDRFDRALAVILEDWDGKAAKDAAVTLSEIADRSGNPAQLIYAAEAHDLVFMSSRKTRRLASALSLAHCRRAATITTGATEGEMKEAARLLAAHLPYLEGSHRGEPAWDAWIHERKLAERSDAAAGEPIGRGGTTRRE